MITVDGKQYKHWPAYWKTIFYPESYARISKHVKKVFAMPKVKFDEDAYEIEQMQEGHRWQEWLADKLRQHGIPASVPELKIRPTRSQINRYTDSADVVVHFKPRIKIEVKAKSLSFTGSIADYPFQTLIFERILTWNRKKQKPDYIVWISTITRGAIALSTKPEVMAALTEENIHDKTRDKQRAHYMIDKRFCIEWEDFLQELMQKGEGK